MESMLYEAALEGSVNSLLQLLEQDQLLLDRVIVNSFNETPLHIASMLGHLHFVKEILRRKPELAKELDSRRFSPLHLASAKGYVEIVKELLRVNPEMCSARDAQDRNSLHLAATKGRIDVLKELVRTRPQAASAIMGSGESILHLCVKSNQLEALKLLVEEMGINELLNVKDGYGMTILHLAVTAKQIETINFLLSIGVVEVNAKNTNGFSALDTLWQSPRDVKDLDILESLQRAGASGTNINILNPISTPKRTGIFKSRKSSAPQIVHHQINPNPMPSQQHFYIPNNITKQEDWLSRNREVLVIVAILIATMAFQAATNPPKDLWTAQNSTENNYVDHWIDQINFPVLLRLVMRTINRSDAPMFVFFNTIGFIASLTIILLLITGLPLARRLFLWILTVISWVAITSMVITYRICLYVSTPEDLVSKEIVSHVMIYGVTVWCGVMGFLLGLHTLHLVFVFLKWCGSSCLCRPRKRPLYQVINV